MKRMIGLACAVVVGLAVGAPAVAATGMGAAGAVAGLPTVTGEPAPGGDAVVKYWNQSTPHDATFIGVGIPGATMQVTAPGLDAVTAKVKADGTWAVWVEDGGDEPWTATISQLVDGKVHDEQTLDLDMGHPRRALAGDFSIKKSECYLGSDTYDNVGTGKAGALVRVSGLGIPGGSEDQYKDGALGQFTVPGDGSWRLESSLESPLPLLFDYYVDGVWQGGLLDYGPGDCHDGTAPAEVAPLVTLAPISDVTATPAASSTETSTAKAGASSATQAQSSSGSGSVGLWIGIGAAVIVAAGVGLWEAARRRRAKAPGSSA